MRAGIEYAEVLSKMGAETFVAAHQDSAPTYEIERYVDKMYSLNAISRGLSDPENIYHIIKYGDRVAGFSRMELNRKHSSISGNSNSKMDQIYLLSSYYGLKLGAKLLQFNIDFSKSHNQYGMWLVVWTENHQAISFYKQFGFSIAGDDVFHLTERHINPCYIMYLKY